mmetsp:Transcript_5143/g.17021  ORF Transcript_5143/g.17021 Transcript_5143/m.17021 type:complete len:318 (+) Transcript_5143:1024-1977(+)|eukprot:scaffold4545_cov111-Isochrysis_galbana.AAC.9
MTLGREPAVPHRAARRALAGAQRAPHRRLACTLRCGGSVEAQSGGRLFSARGDPLFEARRPRIAEAPIEVARDGSRLELTHARRLRSRAGAGRQPSGHHGKWCAVRDTREQHTRGSRKRLGRRDGLSSRAVRGGAPLHCEEFNGGWLPRVRAPKDSHTRLVDRPSKPAAANRRAIRRFRVFSRAACLRGGGGAERRRVGHAASGQGGNVALCGRRAVGRIVQSRRHPALDEGHVALGAGQRALVPELSHRGERVAHLVELLQADHVGRERGDGLAHPHPTTAPVDHHGVVERDTLVGAETSVELGGGGGAPRRVVLD